jgi:pimeloyl-ACP methyl ester carboxylesterase
VPATEPEVLQLQLPAVQLSALAWGPADGPLVVALHGFPDTAWTWRHLGPHLADLGYRVVAPHLRGYAPSGLPMDGSYHLGALMSDAVAMHGVLGGDERAVLVGHDWGAMATNALAAHPDAPFRAFVSMAVPPLPAMSGAPLRLTPRQVQMSWYTLFNQLPALPERVLPGLVRKLWRDWSPGYEASEDLAHVMTSLHAPAHRKAAVGYYRAVRSPWTAPAAYRRWQAAATELPSSPLLYLHGVDDGCLQVGYAEHAAGRLSASARVEVVAGAGHFLQVERPATVNGLVADFVCAASSA